MYDFIGQPLHDNIREHIFNLTEAQSEGYINRRPEALNLFRNSTDLIDRWKKMTSNYVKYWDVIAIEEQCKILFKHLKQTFTGDGTSVYSKMIQRTD